MGETRMKARELLVVSGEMSINSEVQLCGGQEWSVKFLVEAVMQDCLQPIWHFEQRLMGNCLKILH